MGHVSENFSGGSCVGGEFRCDIGLLPGFVSLLGGDNLSLDWFVLDEGNISLTQWIVSLNDGVTSLVYSSRERVLI